MNKPELKAQDVLEKFIEIAKNKNALMDDVKQYVTVTERELSKLVGGKPIEGAINGFHSVIKLAKEINIRELPTSNKVLRDFNIRINNENGKAEITCRCLKEIAIRKTSPEGQWGVVSKSFRYKPL